MSGPRHYRPFNRFMGMSIPFVFAFAAILFIVLWSLHGAGVIDLVGRK